MTPPRHWICLRLYQSYWSPLKRIRIHEILQRSVFCIPGQISAKPKILLTPKGLIWTVLMEERFRDREILLAIISQTLLLQDDATVAGKHFRMTSLYAASGRLQQLPFATETCHFHQLSVLPDECRALPDESEGRSEWPDRSDVTGERWRHWSREASVIFI